MPVDVRLAFATNDIELLKTSIGNAHGYLDCGGDWERRNRLKVFHRYLVDRPSYITINNCHAKE